MFVPKIGPAPIQCNNFNFKIVAKIEHFNEEHFVAYKQLTTNCFKLMIFNFNFEYSLCPYHWLIFIIHNLII